MNELAEQRVGAFFPLRAPALAAIVTGAGTRRVPKRRDSGAALLGPAALPLTAAPPAPRSGPARAPPPWQRSQLPQSRGAVLCMGRAYWPRPACAGQAYVLEAAIGQRARARRRPRQP